MKGPQKSTSAGPEDTIYFLDSRNMRARLAREKPIFSASVGAIEAGGGSAREHMYTYVYVYTRVIRARRYTKEYE